MKSYHITHASDWQKVDNQDITSLQKSFGQCGITLGDIYYCDALDNDESCYVVAGYMYDPEYDKYSVYVNIYYNEDEFFDNEYNCWMRVDAVEGSPLKMWAYTRFNIVESVDGIFDTQEEAQNWLHYFMQKY